VLPFEFIVEAPPVSQQTRRRQERLPAWRATIRAAAQQTWRGGARGYQDVLDRNVYHDLNEAFRPQSALAHGLQPVDRVDLEHVFQLLHQTAEALLKG